MFKEITLFNKLIIMVLQQFWLVSDENRPSLSNLLGRHLWRSTRPSRLWLYSLKQQLQGIFLFKIYVIRSNSTSNDFRGFQHVVHTSLRSLTVVKTSEILDIRRKYSKIKVSCTLLSMYVVIAGFPQHNIKIYIGIQELGQK